MIKEEKTEEAFTNGNSVYC